MKHPFLAAAILPIALAAGCVSAGQQSQDGTGPRTTSALIVEGEDLWTTSGTLLDGLRDRVSTMQVSRVSGGCPRIRLRGQTTLLGSTRPEIYVNGTRMGDTCILDQLGVRTVERVEIYRGGGSGRTGYTSGMDGLIAVFLSNAFLQ